MKITWANLFLNIVCWVIVLSDQSSGLDGAADIWAILGFFCFILIPLGILSLITETKSVGEMRNGWILIGIQTLAVLFYILIAPMAVMMMALSLMKLFS